MDVHQNTQKQARVVKYQKIRLAAVSITEIGTKRPEWEIILFRPLLLYVSKGYNFFMNKNELIMEIIDLINSGKSVVIVGATDGGKSWFIKNEVVPALEENNLKVCYIEECLVDCTFSDGYDVIIADEFETFIDKDFLEKRHPDEVPYYPESYIKQVEDCHKSIEDVKVPIIFVVTRNEEEEIHNLANILDRVDFGQKVKTFIFERSRD